MGVDIVVYPDSSYARDEEDICKASGGAVICAGICVSWLSRSQCCVTAHSTVAKYVAMGHCVKEVFVIHHVLSYIETCTRTTMERFVSLSIP